MEAVSADNPALRIFWQNRYAPAAGLVVSLALILSLAPATVNQDGLRIWAGIGIVLLISSMIDIHRPGFTKNLLPDGLPVTVHIHSAVSGLWIGGVVWVDLGAAGTNEFAYLAGLLVLGTMLGLLQFGTLGWHTPILMASAIAAAGSGFGAAGQMVLALGSMALLGVALRASFSSANTYAELMTLRAEGQDREATATWFANHDPLTNALNRRGIGEWLESDDAEPSFCLFIDLDHFKVINDTFGHAVGDEVLLVTAGKLDELVGNRGAIGRIGGDEFVALLDSTEYGSQARAEEFGHQLLASLRAPLDEHPDVAVSASVGVVPVGDGDSLRELLGRGDTALYEAKERGRGRVVLGADD